MKAGSRPPWLGLSAAVWVQVAGGASSTFALYSHALKLALGVDQRRLALLAVACDVGENLGLLPGVLCNRLHPALLLLIGAAACVHHHVTGLASNLKSLPHRHAFLSSTTYHQPPFTLRFI